MKKVSELISSSIGDTLTNIKTWANVMYNVLEHGLVGDGVTDDTAALQTLINTAIAAGRKLIFFPHGQYYVTSLTNANQVVFIGDNASFVGGYTGTISEFSVNPAVTDLDMGSHKITNLASPSSASDAATKGYVDIGLDGKVSKTGDTVTGMMAFRMGIDVEAANIPPDKIGVIYANGSTGSLNYRDLTGNQVIWHTGNNPSIVSPNGYQKLASGLIIQWGRAIIPSGGGIIVFPIAFPTICVNVQVTADTLGTTTASVNNITPTQVSITQNAGADQNIQYLAIGY